MTEFQISFSFLVIRAILDLDNSGFIGVTVTLVLQSVIMIGFLTFDFIATYRDWKKTGEDVASTNDLREMEQALKARDREIVFKDKELEQKSATINNLKKTLEDTNTKLAKVQESLDNLVKQEATE